jgi:GGDEF domain-containing protein
MGLYLKARSFLDRFGSSVVIENSSKNSFLKGISLLKKLSISENRDSNSQEEQNEVNENTIEEPTLTISPLDVYKEQNDVILDSIDSFHGELTFSSLPDDLNSHTAIIINEDDLIELDVNIDFYPEFEEITEEAIHQDKLESNSEDLSESFNQSLVPNDTIEVGSENEVKDENIENWENDISEEESGKEIEDTPRTDLQIQEDETNKKLDYYLVLNEITNELVQSSSFNDFYDNLLYSLEGQLGPNYIIIVSSLDERFEEYEIISYDGIDLTENINLSLENETIQKIINHKSILESENLQLNELSEDERKIFKLSQHEIVVPIISEENLLGFIVIGEPNLGEKFGELDLEFINLLMNVSSNILVKMYEQEKVQRELNEVSYKKDKIELLNSFSSEIVRFKSYKTLINSFVDTLKKFEINEKIYVYIIDINNNYKSIYNNDLDEFEESTILIDDLLVKLLKAKLTYQIIQDSSEISRLKLGTDPKIIFPLLEENELIGFLAISNKINYENEIFLALLKIMTGQLSRILIEERLMEYSYNPLSKIEDMLREELIKAKEKSESFTLYIIKIQNVGRIINILGNNYFEQYSSYIKNCIEATTSESDTYSKVGQSKFSIFLRNKTTEEFEAFQGSLKNKLNEFQNPPRDFKISIQIFTLRFPDQSVDLRKYIELIEET